jgi:hypothetical protein
MVGFDVAVNPKKIAAILAKALEAEVEVGQGLDVNGLQPGSLYVHLRKKRNGKR